MTEFIPWEIKKEFGVYWYYDNVRGVNIRIRQIQGRGYDKSAHVTIWAEAPIGEMHRLYRARTSITTNDAHQKIANTVSRRINGDEKRNDEGLLGVFGITSPIVTNDWSATMNHACEEVLETYYAGTPPIKLREDDIEEDDDWRIPALISEDINIIYGQSGSGKSYLSVIWAQAINHGADFCGLRTVQGNVLYIDYETTDSKMRRRMKRVNAGLNISGSQMDYMGASVPIPQQVESLQTYILENDIEFLVIASLARACGGKITDEEGVGEFFEAIRQLERPCLIVHHTNRADEYYGSPYIRANARNLWRLRSVHSEGQDKLSIQLEQEKENDGAGVGQLGFVMQFHGDPIDPEAVTVAPQDASLVPELRKYERNLVTLLQYHLEESVWHRMLIDDVHKVLGLNKTKSELFRNYIWDMKSGANKHKKLNKLMHLDDSENPVYLCLNTDRGYADMYEEPEDALYQEPEPSGGVTL